MVAQTPTAHPVGSPFRRSVESPAMDARPVGVFDSGMGGLTVLHELLVTLPHEDFVYLGDARAAAVRPAAAAARSAASRRRSAPGSRRRA